MKRDMRFDIKGQGWSRWYKDGDDLSFLRDNCEVVAVEISEEMTREEFAKKFPEEAAKLVRT